MATPVEVSRIQRNGDRIERLGGMWRDRPWSMSARNMLAEVELPASERQWDFFVSIGGGRVAVAVTLIGDRKALVAAGSAQVLLALPERRPDEPVPA